MSRAFCREILGVRYDLTDLSAKCLLTVARFGRKRDGGRRRAELPRIRETCGLPVLALHLTGEGPADGAWTTRLQAFLEMLA